MGRPASSDYWRRWRAEHPGYRERERERGRARRALPTTSLGHHPCTGWMMRGLASWLARPISAEELKPSVLLQQIRDAIYYPEAERIAPQGRHAGQRGP